MAATNKTFVNGTELPASDLNTYLMQQAVVKVATLADLTTALATTNGVRVAYCIADSMTYIWSVSRSLWQPSTGVKTVGGAGNFFGPDIIGSATSTPTLNRIYYTPFRVYGTMTVDTLIARTGSTVATGATIQMGIYTSNLSSGLPENLIGNTAVVAATTALAQISAALGTAVVLTPGLYWLSIVPLVSVTSALYIGTALTTQFGGQSYMLMTNTYNNTMPYPELYDTTYTAVTPGVAGTVSLSATRSPIVLARRSA